MFTITPLGSCRIATPLRLQRSEFGFKLKQTRVYGFCHSSAEAVQMMRYLQGQVDLPPEIAHLVARRSPATLAAAAHHPADLYIIEISSAKVLRIGDTCIQLNYLTTEYSDFFADRARASGFWKVVATDDQAVIDRFLGANWSDTDHRRRDGHLLRRIRRSDTSEAALRRDIRTLIDALPATLFVTHVNALKPDGRPIASRARFIAMVEAAVRAEGGIVYNPTAAMHRVGQNFAIEDNSDSLAHFTQDFCQIVFQDWFDLAIGPRMDTVARAADDARLRTLLSRHVDAMLERGDGSALATRLEDLARHRPDSRVLDTLLARIHTALGNSEEALRRLDCASQSDNPTEAARLLRQRAELALELGRHDEVENAYCRLADMGFGPGANDLMKAADALRAAGSADRAFRLYALALQRNGDLAAAASAMFDLACTGPEPEATGSELLATLTPKDVARMGALLGPADAWRLARGVGDAPAQDALRACAPTLDGDALDALLAVLEPDEGVEATAALIAEWRTVQGADRLTSRALRARVEGWFRAATSAPETATQLALLAHVLTADPQHQSGRIQLRALRRTLIARMRAAYKAEDLAALEALAPALAPLPERLDEYDLLRMRLLFSRGDYARAITAASRVTQTAPDHLPAWTLMMRAAARSGDVLTLDRASGRVLALSDADSDRLGAEAAARRKRLPPQAFRAACAEPDPLRAFRLLQLARRNPALQAAAEKRLRKIEAQLSAELRAREIAGDSRFEDFARTVVRLIPHNTRVRLSVGRFLLRKRDYAGALPHWDMLLQQNPGTATYSRNRDRCRARLGISA